MKEEEGAGSAVKDDEESVEKPETEESEAASKSNKSEEKDVLFQRTITFFNITDPARLFKAKIGNDEKFSLLFPVSEANPEHPLEV